MIVLFVLCGLLLAFGRFYQGENFPHQVLVGLCYGYILYVLFVAFNEQYVEFCTESGFKYNTANGKKYLVGWFIGTISLIIVSIICYSLLASDVEIKWIKNAVHQCNDNY